MIERKITVPIYLTPQELAFEFCNMDDSGQAEFFNCLHSITGKWDRPLCFRLQMDWIKFDAEKPKQNEWVLVYFEKGQEIDYMEYTQGVGNPNKYWSCDNGDGELFWPDMWCRIAPPNFAKKLTELNDG